MISLDGFKIASLGSKLFEVENSSLRQRTHSRKLKTRHDREYPSMSLKEPTANLHTVPSAYKAKHASVD